MNRFDIMASSYDPFMKIFGLYKPDTIIKHLNPAQDETILDVAGGTGFLANLIYPSVKHIVVLDASHKMLDMAKKRHNGLGLCHASSDSMPFEDETFDCILCTDTLHHLRNVDGTLSEIARVLKKSGRILIMDFKLKGLLWGFLWLFEKIVMNSKFIEPKDLTVKMEKHNIPGDIIKVSKSEFIYLGTKS